MSDIVVCCDANRVSIICRHVSLATVRVEWRNKTQIDTGLIVASRLRLLGHVLLAFISRLDVRNTGRGHYSGFYRGDGFKLES